MISIQTRNNGIVLATKDQILAEYQKSRQSGIITEKSKNTYLRLLSQARNQERKPRIEINENGEEFYNLLRRAMAGEDLAEEMYENCAGQSLGQEYKDKKKRKVNFGTNEKYDPDNAAFTEAGYFSGHVD